MSTLKYLRHKLSEGMVTIGFILLRVADHIHSDSAKPLGLIDHTRWTLEDLIRKYLFDPFWNYSATDLEVAHDVYEHSAKHCSSRQIAFIHSGLTVNEFIKNELKTSNKYIEEDYV